MLLAGLVIAYYITVAVPAQGSDALWLFEESHEKIKTPLRHYNDILGEGLSGTIYGNRARIPKVRLGKFEVLQPTVSFLDTISTLQARKFGLHTQKVCYGIDCDGCETHQYAQSCGCNTLLLCPRFVPPKTGCLLFEVVSKPLG